MIVLPHNLKRSKRPLFSLDGRRLHMRLIAQTIVAVNRFMAISVHLSDQSVKPIVLIGRRQLFSVRKELPLFNQPIGKVVRTRNTFSRIDLLLEYLVSPVIVTIARDPP